MNAANISSGGTGLQEIFRPLRQQGRRWFPDVFAALACIVPLGCFLYWFAWSSQTNYYVRMMVDVDRPAVLQVFIDSGTGFAEENSVRVDIQPGSAPQDKRFPISVGPIKALRFDPADGKVVMHLHSMDIRSKTIRWFKSRLLKTLDLKDLKVGQQVDEIKPDGHDGVTIRTSEESDDPYTIFTPAQPILLWPDLLSLGTGLFAVTAGWLLLWVAVAESIRRLTPRATSAAAEGYMARHDFWRRRSPAQAVWLVAGASVVLSCYPVIFCGKSFCSPNFAEGTYQLYGSFPTLPGSKDKVQSAGNGADLGSMAWAHGPYAVVESRAVFHDGQLPLWNRYNYSGVPLLGQGQSMFGDPLHLIVLLAGGRAWAWDLKFLLAKLLFAAGVGFLVLAATSFLPGALLLSFSSAFIGFFSYRLNHPAFFSLCYAPWIVVAWLKIVDAPTWQSAMRRAGGLLLANWMVMNSGTAKEAYMDLFGLNLCGSVLLLCSRRPGREKLLWFLGLAVAGIIFSLLAAPVLTAFFDTMRVSSSNYDERHAWQLQPGMLIGLFDDIFYRQFNLNEQHQDPSLNFFVLLGTLLALSNFKRLITNRVFLAVSLSALLSAALVFGVVPPSVIRAFPILGNVVHIANTFSCVLFIHVFVLAGFGLKACLTQAARRAWSRDVLVAFLLGGALLALYFGFVQASQNTTAIAFLKLDEEVPRSAFFYAYVPTLVTAVLLLPFVLRRLRLAGPQAAPVALLAISLLLIHWRQGIQLPNPLSRYTAVLPNRVDLLAKSPTTDFLRADSPDAFRAVGLNGNLMLGYSGVIGIENIIGPDALINPYYRALEDTGLKEVDGWLVAEVNRELLMQTKAFFDLLNVRYYLVTPGESLADVPDLSLVHHADLDVYRNATAWPRAYWVNRLGVYNGVDDFVAQVNAADGGPFAWIDETELPGRPDLAKRFSKDQSDRGIVAGTNYRLTNRETSFDLNVPEPGVVVLTEAFELDDFVATLNGQRAPIFRVNHAFKGLLVDRAGSYHVSFTYRPRYFNLALVASGVGLVLLALAGWWLCRAPGAVRLPWPMQKNRDSRQPALSPRG